MNCIKTAIFIYLLWFSLSVFVYGIRDFFNAVSKRNEAMNLFNSYLYEIVFMSIFLFMVFADFIEDIFFRE